MKEFSEVRRFNVSNASTFLVEVAGLRSPLSPLRSFVLKLPQPKYRILMPSTEFVFKDPRNALGIKGKTFIIRVKTGQHVIPRFKDVNKENFNHVKITKGVLSIAISKGGKRVSEQLKHKQSYNLKNQRPLNIEVLTNAEIEFSRSAFSFSSPLPDPNSEIGINPS